MEEYLKFERKADRLEVLIIRGIYSFIIGIISGIYALIGGICGTLQWWVILITGERNEGLNNPIKNYIEYWIQTNPYLWALTDEHPEMSHRRMRIYLERLGYGNKKDFLRFEREADRLEVLIIRPIYTFIIGMISGIYALIGGICVGLQWWVILITGERNESLADPIKTYIEYSIQVMPYILQLTDERPELTPENMRIFIEIFD